jgi:hypothetical protein
MLERVSDPSLKQIIEHVTDEEREHVAEMYQLIMERDPKQLERSQRGEQQLRAMKLAHGPQPASALASEPPVEATTAAAAAGLTAPLLVPLADDPFPPPAPIFPDGSWSVGGLKRSHRPAASATEP